MTTATAVNEQSTFSQSCSVTIRINASPETVWALMTDAAHIPEWNTTVISLSGSIAPNGKIELVSTADPDRTFSLKVTTFNKPHKMVWEDGFAPMFKGVRTYTFTPQGDGSTNFIMEETFSGLMMPMIGGSLPDFRSNFEQFARDLKQAAESL